MLYENFVVLTLLVGLLPMGFLMGAYFTEKRLKRRFDQQNEIQDIHDRIEYNDNAIRQIIEENDRKVDQNMDEITDRITAADQQTAATA